MVEAITSKFGKMTVVHCQPFWNGLQCSTSLGYLQSTATDTGLHIYAALLNTENNRKLFGCFLWFSVFSTTHIYDICSPYGLQFQCIPRLFAVRMAIFYFIHQMAIHNTTKLSPLRSQTKLTLTVTLTLTDTVTIIFLCALHWHS